MRAVWLSFFHTLKFFRKDRMLLAAGLAPFLAGTAIYFGVPFVERMLTRFTGMAGILSPYYGLLTIFFASITPVMCCFIFAMVILEEHDEHIDRYLFVTGLGRSGYFVSRIVIPSLAAFVVTVFLLPLFRLTALSVGTVFLLSLTGTLQGIIVELLIVTLSSNKLEGMAVTKLSTLTIFGAVLPFFVPAPFCYCLSFLSSFWVGMAMLNSVPGYMLLAVLLAGVWIMGVQVRFYKKY